MTLIKVSIGLLWDCNSPCLLEANKTGSCTNLLLFVLILDQCFLHEQSSAVGVACAGQLYFCASFTLALLLTLLRFGPRQRDMDDSGSMGGTEISTGGAILSSEGMDPELQPLRRSDAKMTNSVRHRTSLGGIL